MLGGPFSPRETPAKSQSRDFWRPDTVAIFLRRLRAIATDPALRPCRAGVGKRGATRYCLAVSRSADHPAELPAKSAVSGMDEQALQSLMAGVVRRDPQALAGLYDVALARVYGLALRILKRPEDAEEVVGDVFLQVWDKCADYRPERGSVLAWLSTLAWSRAVDRVRRQRHRQREQSLHPEGSDDAYTGCEDDTAHVDEALDAWMSAQAIQRAFCQLSAGQRRMLELAYFEDLSHPEIAQRTGVALGTVKSHIRRGLSALRAVMNIEDTSNGSA